jgi:hypothetical protein
MLPWDEWGRMTEAYEDETGPGYDRLVDMVAEACLGGDPAALTGLFANEDLTVPHHMIS